MPTHSWVANTPRLTDSDRRAQSCRFALAITRSLRTICTVQSVGEGLALWRVRVELFADGSARRVRECAAALEKLLPADDGQTLPGIGADHGVDQGIGDSARPVVALLFWTHADDLGRAADTSVEFARRVGRDAGVGPRLYKVTVVPADAVARPDDPLYPDPET